MQHALYLITPFAAWLVAGCLKFAINSLRAGRPVGAALAPEIHDYEARIQKKRR